MTGQATEQVATKALTVWPVSLLKSHVRPIRSQNGSVLIVISSSPSGAGQWYRRSFHFIALSRKVFPAVDKRHKRGNRFKFRFLNTAVCDC